jgi:hypothetical protein
VARTAAPPCPPLPSRCHRVALRAPHLPLAHAPRPPLDHHPLFSLSQQHAASGEVSEAQEEAQKARECADAAKAAADRAEQARSKIPPVEAVQKK